MNNRILILFLSLFLLPSTVFGAPPKENVETKTVPFLGMATTGATPEQRIEAGLPECVGLTVRDVLPDSPADAAGLQPGDVLHRLDDQILINDPQFRVLVRMHRPGEKIELTFIRRGEAATATVLLQQRDVPVWEVPPDELVQWLTRPSPGAAAVRTMFSASYEDDEHILILTTDGKKKHLLAKDVEGTTLFDGPVDTPKQRQKVPQAIHPKLLRLESPPRPAPKAIHPSLEQPDVQGGRGL